MQKQKKKLRRRKKKIIEHERGVSRKEGKEGKEGNINKSVVQLVQYKKNKQI